MGIYEDWHDLMFSLQCLSKGSAKRQFRQSIKYGFGGLCAYCRERRATTVDHLRPRSKGGSSLRSNLVPACHSCNHAKGSEDWLSWYQRQSFYSRIAEELINEWVTNKRYDDHEEQVNDEFNNRTEVCSSTCEIRSRKNEPPCTREDDLAVA